MTGVSGSGVAVVIVNFNGEHLLPDCLAALAAQTLAPDDIVVADNGSRDGSLALLRAHHPQVRALELGHNHGFAGGANRGVRATSAPWVCVLNSDATPQPDWLAELMAAPHDDRTWALGSVLVSATTGLIESAGDAYAPQGYAHKLLRERPLDDLPAQPYRVFAAPGAAPVLRRRTFDLLGGYEERFFLYYEDIDLAFRAALAGHHALLVPSARVVHQLGATTRSIARLRFYVARNSMWCAVRCLPDLPVRTLLRRWSAELRVNRPRRCAPAEVAGRIAGVAGLPRAWRERRAIQARRVATPQDIAALLALGAPGVRQSRHGKGNRVQLIRIAGPTEPMVRLAEVVGLDFERTSARRLGDDRWQVSGYATDDALATLRERGLDVEPVIEPGELDEQRRVLFADLDAKRAREAQQ